MPQSIAPASCGASYASHVNPQWVRLLDLLQMNVEYEYCRGAELFCGIKLRAPKRLSLRIPFEPFRKVHPGLFGQALVSKLFNGAGVLTQICGNNFMVLKVAPPLIVTQGQVDRFVTAIDRAMDQLHSSSTFWSENLELASRAIRI